ncbi:cycloartenol synthase [Cymbomonas tetramitiformis]|uniref:Cycloartenol synthase n=1 Tax=Cymbomonas tetramitiformis TaxID=36881 RepID=A0AAE0FUA9_9CHLO|nr:cycloartenol synthase [Cymbomonas tetramitiformis]
MAPVDKIPDVAFDREINDANKTGGFATYENTRSYGILEWINPAETFGDIMIDYDYVECSSACITALAAFAKSYPQHRAKEIQTSIGRGKSFLLSIQRRDGSWYGSWGVCFTYAAWFGVDGLTAAGETWRTCKAIRRCCDFLLSKQRRDGGWGESYLSCQDKVYTQLPQEETSHAVNTAWAMLALMQGGQAERDAAPLHAAARLLMRLQAEDGDWPQQSITGVFNRNCMITYANYRNIFPLWALGEYQHKVLQAPSV